MVKIFEKEIILILILVVFSGSLFFIGLDKMPLTDPDEVFYAETAKEMLNRDELLTQYIFGKPQFEKPPLYYWLVLFGFRAFGVNEFSARAGSAIFGILGVIGIYLLGKLLINKRTGFLSGIVLATSVEYLILARACVTDIVLGVLILYAFLFFFYGYYANSGKNKHYLLSSVFLGLAVLTKGPVALLLPGAIIFLYLIIAKELKKLKEIPLIQCAILFLAVSSPWYFLMYRVHGKEFMDVFFGFHNVVRFLHPEHKWGDVVYYYVPILIGGFAPWTILLPAGIWQARKEQDLRIKRTNIFILIWISVIFVFFSISRTKLPTYIFPLYPALALPVGRVLDVFLDNALGQKIKTLFRTSLYTLSLALASGMVGLYVFAKMRYPTVANASLITGVVFILFMMVFIALLLKRRYAHALFVYTVSFIVLILPLSYIVLPEVGRYESSKEISEKVLKLAGPGEEIGAETHYRRGVAFYTDREGIPDIHSHDSCTKFLNRKERVWGILKEKNHIQLYTDEKNPYKRTTYVVYKLGKKVIVTNKVPPDGKFLKVRTQNATR